MNLQDLHTFSLVADLGTFSAAATALGVPTSTVSRRVRRLEDALRVALLTRSSRSFVLTDDGRALQARTAPALRELEHITSDLGDGASTPRGVLTVTVPIDLGGSALVAGLIAGFSRAHPQVRVRLDVTNRTVDLVEESVDVALRVHNGLPDRDDLVARRLSTLDAAVFASATHPTLERRIAHAREHDLETAAVVVNDYGPMAELVAAGAGTATLPLFLADPLVATGRLKPIGAVARPAGTLSLVWPRSRHLAPRVRAFIDYAVSALASGE